MDLSTRLKISSDKVIQRLLVQSDSSEVAFLMAYHLDDEAAQAVLRNMSKAAQDMIEVDRRRMREAVEKAQTLLESLIAEENGLESEKAILFTDLVSSTEKANRLGDDRFYEMVMVPHDRILTARIKERRGLIIKTIGDAYLAVFDSIRNAIEACLDAQADFDALNRSGDPEYALNVRMALHYGRLSFKQLDDSRFDIFGSSVNYASRLIGVAGGGEIYVSKNLRDNLRLEGMGWEENKAYRLSQGEKPDSLAWIDERIADARRFETGLRISHAGFYSFKGFEGDQEVFTLSREVSS